MRRLIFFLFLFRCSPHFSYGAAGVYGSFLSRRKNGYDHGVGFTLHLDAWSGYCIFALRATFLCPSKIRFLFHWIDGMRHKFYRATGLGCRGYTALEGEYHEELGFIYSTDFTYSYLTV